MPSSGEQLLVSPGEDRCRRHCSRCRCCCCLNFSSPAAQWINRHPLPPSRAGGGKKTHSRSGGCLNKRFSETDLNVHVVEWAEDAESVSGSRWVPDAACRYSNRTIGSRRLTFLSFLIQIFPNLVLTNAVN